MKGSRSLRNGPFRSGTIPIVIALVVLGASIGPSVGDVAGDGGFIPVIAIDVHEPGQNAVIVFNGGVERLYLSVNINAEKSTQGFHVIPFPSMPRISLGSLSIFKNITAYMNESISERYNGSKTIGEHGDGLSGEGPSVSVLLFEQLGEHRITVIKVEDPTDFRDDLREVAEFLGFDVNGWPDGLDGVIQGYVDRGIDYFTLDSYPIYKDERTMDPLVFEFNSDSVFFPLEISSVFKGTGEIDVSILTPEGLPLGTDYRNMAQREYIFHLTRAEMDRIDPAIKDMIPGDASLIHIEISTDMSELKGDLVIPIDNSIVASHNIAESWISDSCYRIDDGTMLVYDASDREFEALALPGFERIWNRTFDGVTPPYVEFRSLVLGGEPILLAYVNGLRERSIKRIDPRSGYTIWSVEARDMSFSSTTIDQWPSVYGPLIAIVDSGLTLMDPDDGRIIPTGWSNRNSDLARGFVKCGESKLLSYSDNDRGKCYLFSPFNISYHDPRDGTYHENVSGDIPLSGGFILQRQIMDWELITGRPIPLEDVLEMDMTAEYPLQGPNDKYDRMWRNFRDDDFGTVAIRDSSDPRIYCFDKTDGGLRWCIWPDGYFHGWRFHAAFFDVDHDLIDEMVLYDLYDDGQMNNLDPSRLMVIESTGDIILDEPVFCPSFPMQTWNGEYIIAGMGTDDFSCIELASGDVLYRYPIDRSIEDGGRRMYIVSYWDGLRSNLTYASIHNDPLAFTLLRSNSSVRHFENITYRIGFFDPYDFGSTIVFTDQGIIYSFNYNGSIPSREYPTIDVPEDDLGVDGLMILLEGSDPGVREPLIAPYPGPAPVLIMTLLVALVSCRVRKRVRMT